MFYRTEHNKDRTEQGRTVQDGFSLFDISVDCTGVLAMPIFSISQGTFVWLIFLASKFLKIFQSSLSEILFLRL